MKTYLVDLHHYWSLLLSDFAQLQVLEAIAVVFALAYLILAIRQNSLCWYAAFISTTLYTIIFWETALLMESALQLYYLAMAVYGWWQWRQPNALAEPLLIRCWSIKRHILAVLVISCLTIISGSLLSNHTSAALPYLDSFTTWGAVITTYLVTKKIFENWIYWLVIDGVSIFLYWDRGLILTTALFSVYIILVLIGLFSWLKILRKQEFNQAQHPSAM